jgi:adenine-specific DNA-methyltransferase
MDKRYRNPDNHKKGPWKATPLYAKRIPSERERSFTYTFKNGVTWSPPEGTCPRFPAEELARLDENDEIWFGVDGKAIPSRKTFLESLTIASPPSATIWLHSEAGNNHEARNESKLIGPSEVFGTPKPENLLNRVLALATESGDLVLDSFLGSGTTAAVAHKMGRRWIGIEVGERAQTHCAARLRKVIEGEQGGISKDLDWQGGGGFRFGRLGTPVFDGRGSIQPGVGFADLARWVWYRETRQPLAGTPASPLLGVHQGTAYYLLFNGILGDRRPEGGNFLTAPVLADLPPHDEPRVVFGEACRLHESKLATLGLCFRKLPYQANA